MAGQVFEEINGYFVWSGAWQQPEGRWFPTVYFERKWAPPQTLVPGMRHVVKKDFPSEKEAIQVAMDFGRAHAKADDTGL